MCIPPSPSSPLPHPPSTALPQPLKFSARSQSSLTETTNEEATHGFWVSFTCRPAVFLLGHCAERLLRLLAVLLLRPRQSQDASTPFDRKDYAVCGLIQSRCLLGWRAHTLRAINRGDRGRCRHIFTFITL